VYIQEIGRAGRNGDYAGAIMYFNSTDIASSVSHVSEEMREFCLTDTCRRKYMQAYFGDNSTSSVTICRLCCDNCFLVCQCVSCIAQMN
jgi:superfamily II DNA helicase RecQ